MELLDNLQRTPSQQDGIRSRFLLMADFLLESKQSIFGHLKTAARFPFATRLRKIFSLSFISLASLLLLLVIVISAIVLYPKAIEAKEAWSKVGVAIETKDLESIQSTLGELDFAVSDLERSFGYLTYLKFIPNDPQKHLTVLTLTAAADGLMDVTVAMFMEKVRHPKDFNAAFIAANEATVKRCFAYFDAQADALEELNIASIALASAIGYLNFRMPQLWPPSNYPKLARWYEEFSMRKSMQETVPREK